MKKKGKWSVTDSHDSVYPNTLSGLDLACLDPEENISISSSLQVQDQLRRWEGCLVALDCPGEMPLRPRFYDTAHVEVNHQSLQTFS